VAVEDPREPVDDEEVTTELEDDWVGELLKAALDELLLDKLLLDELLVVELVD
jgi:hypothetical protein